MDIGHDLPQVPRSEPVLPPSSQEIPSSPPSIASDVGGRRKLRKPPPVTPRSFRKFFTPRSMLNGDNGGVRANRQALQTLSSPAINRLGPAFSRTLKAAANRPALHEPAEIIRTPSKKRKLSFSSIGSPLQSSPLRKVRIRAPVQEEEELSVPVKELEVGSGFQDDEKDDVVSEAKPLVPVPPIRKSRALQTSGGLYMRSLARSRENRVTIRSNAGAGWQDMTSNFYSRPDDIHACPNYTGDRLALPLCTASCNTNSLVAIGYEEGGVRLLDSAKDDKDGFSKAYLTFRPHMNALMDLEFSSDDSLLATASGDQTALVIDMATQTPIYCLSNHISSIKRVQFQPASNNKILATCSRDGNVSIWDLRCKGFERPSLQVQCSLDSDSEQHHAPTSKMVYPQVLNTIHGAHSGASLQSLNPDKAEAHIGRSDITVTSLAFLPPGRENLFVTASEANASVRLWDIRTAHSNRRGRQVLPVSTTQEPDSHVKYRRFGLTSMTFGGDGSRLYTLCRDGTVYAHSTSHLILGHAPELSLNNTRPRRTGGSDKEGLGPLYGFRHPRLQVASFYLKVAVRKAKDDKPEMLAVGSSDQCAVLFPTDEKFLHSSPAQHAKEADENEAGEPPLPRTPRFRTPRPSLRRTNSTTSLSGKLEDTIPIYQTGTPLVEGHKKEVSGVSWTESGELITVSDDCSARCWREGPDGRDLRVGGEAEGRRWHCGWADTKDSNDDQDE